MQPDIIRVLERLDNYLWAYLAVPGIFFLGGLLSIKSGFIQLRKFPSVLKTLFSFFKAKDKDSSGIHPLKVFFACIGGSTGISNIVAVCTAIQIGGPGALFWLWVAAIAGMILKYSEVYLGMRYRVFENGSWQGGPQYYLEKAFKSKWIPKLVCFLLCIYGVEVYQFSVVASSMESLFPINKQLLASILIILVLGIGSGGVKRVGQFSSMIIPIFLLCYLSMGAWIFYQNAHLLPDIFHAIIKSAFTGHATAGAFAGSGIMLTMSSGIRRGCYSGDVGMGYASVIHSQTDETKPERQGSLAIFDIFLDSFVICTTSLLLVMVTGLWSEPIDAAVLIQKALGKYFPFMDFFMPLFLLLLGYTTILAYFCAGLKCAEHLEPRFGKWFFYAYAIFAWFFFSCLESSEALVIMSTTGALLLFLNLIGIFRLRHEIDFHAIASKPNKEKLALINSKAQIPYSEKIA